ncbi:Crp/Fnr family transcriptional regulator [Mucilaginibacter sp. cycad4]|uniref:Crp/Fnr family transcriptional regulator n=1 Tax=Mucilaginibacter sp. cycad4 TaxID=3342096 RepID=UPI002AAC08D8|nr:Crp/Fnr family transcriptional regulator [Mucilaginibacter gossypii]WPU97837.1 Crp/Fnr family transcriptional regulator [Mucilaginibacter gossypii]
MNTRPLINLLTGITTISSAFELALSDRLEQEQYKPHQILHAAGQMENRLYFIETGFARNYFYDKDGQEHTVKFREPGDILFSYEGYYKVPSYFYTEIMEESRLISLTYHDLHELDSIFTEVSVLIKSLLLRFQKEEYQRQSLIALPNEERYLQLRKNNNALFQRTPSRIIASYLHMSRETLNRLIARH